METERLTFQAVLKWTDEECRGFLERMRWPNGPICPKCGAGEPYSITRKSRTKNTVQSLYKCRACRKQFTATVGTIFEDSHIPLSKWLAALFLMCSSKKGISAHQLFRMLDLGSYRTAWFMAHRIREAMKDKDILPLLGVVEADETYLHPRRQRGSPSYHERIKDETEMGLRPVVKRDWREGKPIVFGMVERGGKARTMKVQEATRGTLQPLMLRGIDLKTSRLVTDGNPAYRRMKEHLPHDVIDHEIEYVQGEIHTQNIDGYWSILKRGVYGVFHHVSEDYLPQYLNEFEYRFNRRKISDVERFAALMAQTQGRLLWYCRTPQPQNPFA